MSTVAEQLRQGREARGLTVEQVAEVTKIRTDHLRALEEIERVPGEAFNVGNSRGFSNLEVVKTAELVHLRDQFGHERLAEKKYAPGQIDSAWSEDIERDFSRWLNDHMDKLPVPKEDIQEYLKKRTW